MTVYDLIEELKKIPNKNLEVKFTPMSNSFVKYYNIKYVDYDSYRCSLVLPVNDEFFVSDEELERMKEDGEIW